MFQRPNGERRRVAIDFPEQGRTKQSFKAECDINNIMAKFQRTGVLEFANKHQPAYGDVSGMDFQSAMDTVIQAQQMFDELPSSVRKRFHNNPAELLDFVGDEQNREEAIKLGLIEKPEKREPIKAPEAKPAAPEAPDTPV